MREINNSTNFIKMLAQTKDPDVVREKLTTIAHTIGVENFRKTAARQIVAGTQPERAIPDVYHPYRALVRDGIRFFLSHISLQRLLDVMVCQLQLDRECSAEERLLELAKQFPTLHKLGQIIARNQNIEPGVKRWLVHLENGKYGTAQDDILAHIKSRLEATDERQAVQIDPFILSEASVGAVIAFKWNRDSGRDAIKGVFKVLKPNVKEKLEEELAVFEKMAVFFENNRRNYAFNDFKFLDVFEDVREILKKEVNLHKEQSYLSEAARVYENTKDIVIPELITLCDNTMTAMGYIDGEKITDADLTFPQRRHCANKLAESLICRPLFATDDSALFHGDPHAGNILLSEVSEAGSLKIALLDWSLAGHLTQKVRIKIVGLIKSILLDDPDRICACLLDIAKKPLQSSTLSQSGLRRIVHRLMKFDDYARFSLMKKAFWLLEQLSYEGVVFPSDLMLFRKAVFTLEGVLFDLYPQFSMDTFVIKYMSSLLAQEMPRRFGNALFFQEDNPENYQSLLSNSDLQMIMLYQYTAAAKHNTRAAVELFEKQNQIMRHFFPFST